MASTVSKIKDRIRKSKRILIAGHQSPDFDSVCACLALYLVLRQQGKAAEIASSFREAEWDFVRAEHQLEFKSSQNYDLALLLDYGSFDRLENMALNYLTKRQPYIITIDHHEQQTQQGDLLWVDTKKSSSCEMVYDLLKSLGWRIDDEVAFLLLLGICYDTNIFININTTIQLLAKARQLFRQPDYLSRIDFLLNRWGDEADLALFGKYLQKVRVDKDLGLAYLILTRTKGIGFDRLSVIMHRLVQKLFYLAGVKISLVLRQRPQGGYKASLRGSFDNQVDLNKIAAQFGGGGHLNAAGFKSSQSGAKIVATVEQLIVQQLKNQAGK